MPNPNKKITTEFDDPYKLKALTNTTDTPIELSTYKILFPLDKENVHFLIDALGNCNGEIHICNACDKEALDTLGKALIKTEGKIWRIIFNTSAMTDEQINVLLARDFTLLTLHGDNTVECFKRHVKAPLTVYINTPTEPNITLTQKLNKRICSLTLHIESLAPTDAEKILERNSSLNVLTLIQGTTQNAKKWLNDFVKNILEWKNNSTNIIYDFPKENPPSEDALAQLNKRNKKIKKNKSRQSNNPYTHANQSRKQSDSSNLIKQSSSLQRTK